MLLRDMHILFRLHRCMCSSFNWPGCLHVAPNFLVDVSFLSMVVSRTGDAMSVVFVVVVVMRTQDNKSAVFIGILIIVVVL